MAQQDRLREKDRYEDLTDKQKAVIDAKVHSEHNNLDWGRNRLATHATKLLQERLDKSDSVSSSYVPVVLQSQQKLIKERMSRDDIKQTAVIGEPEPTEEPESDAINTQIYKEEYRQLHENVVPESLLDRLDSEVIDRAFQD